MVRFRRANLDDAKFLINLRNHPDVKRWFRQVFDLSEQEQIEFMRNTKAQDYYQFIIQLGLEDVGFVALAHIDHFNKRAEFSIAIHPRFQKKGIASQAMKFILNVASELGLIKVYSDVFEDNPALKLYEKMGFVKEGKLRNHYLKDGKFINSVLIAHYD